MPAATTVFAASEIVTLNRSLPRATHVAVRDGRILGYGGPEIVAAFGGRLDERFATKVIVPGFEYLGLDTTAARRWLASVPA